MHRITEIRVFIYLKKYYSIPENIFRLLFLSSDPIKRDTRMLDFIKDVRNGLQN